MAALTVRVAVVDGRLQARLSGGDGPAVGRLLAGQPPEAALSLLPVVFNLCAAAHSRAAAAALGLPIGGGLPSPSACGDILRDHALALLRDWPQCLNRPPDGEGLRLVGAVLAGKDGAEAALRCHIFGSAFTGFDAWLAGRETATAGLLAGIRDLSADCAAVPPLPVPTTDEMIAAAHGMALPLREMTCGERAGGERAGCALTSIFQRLCARVADFALWLDRRVDEAALGTTAPGVGLALASRGRLAHGVTLAADGRIAEYRVVTPTDWNRQPGGLLERLIAGIPAGPEQEKLLRLAVACADPCVPVDIIWEEKNREEGDRADA